MFRQCPGDTLVATAAVGALARQHPGRFRVDVQGAGSEAIFEDNPHVSLGSGGREIVMDNPLIHECDKRPVHFMDSYVHHLERELGVPLKLDTNRPELYLSDEEHRWMSQVEELTGDGSPYWVVNAGVKKCYTVKGWGRANFQEVVNQLRGEVRFVQVGLAEHGHPPLSDVLDLRGKTDTRQLVRLCHHAQGGVGPESFLHHLFAALGKSYLCLLSGFLPRTWIDYPTATVLHRANLLPCYSREKGCCWKARTVKLGDGDDKDRNLCSLPVIQGVEAVPKCLDMIRPEEVAGLIRAARA